MPCRSKQTEEQAKFITQVEEEWSEVKTGRGLFSQLSSIGFLSRHVRLLINDNMQIPRMLYKLEMFDVILRL